MSGSRSSLDVLVIGAGLAGLAAATEALASGARVGLVSAGPASSHRAQGGIAAAIGDCDSVALHAEDTLAAGGQTGDPGVVADITASAPAAIEWLERKGVVFDRGADGQPALGLEGGHSRPRVLHAGEDRSGVVIMASLDRWLARWSDDRLTQFQGFRLERLLLSGAGVAGALLSRGKTALAVPARATVLATGGFAGLFPRTTNSPLTDGRGIVEAHRAGAGVADLDLVQYHPTVFAGPGRPFLITEALRGAGAVVTDSEGRRFLFEIDPRGELASRDTVSRAIATHMRRSGESHTLLDARPLGSELRLRFPGFVARCNRVGIDPVREPVPIAPGAHYTMGGVVTDSLGRTSIPYLWAAGECGRTGLHGLNRLASNSLLEAVVVGRRAGAGAAQAEGESGLRCPLVTRRVGSSSIRPRISLAAVKLLLGELGVLPDPIHVADAISSLKSSGGANPESEAGRVLALLILQAARTRQKRI